MTNEEIDAARVQNERGSGLSGAAGSALTDTPRTDAKAPVTIYDHMGQEYTADLVPAELSRQLERENAAMKLAIAEAQKIAQRHAGHWQMQVAGPHREILNILKRAL